VVKTRRRGVFKVNNIGRHCGIENDGITSFKSLKLCRVCDNNLYRYGLNRKEVLAIWEAQDKKCHICKIPLDMFMGKNGGHVDHDHDTEEVRGILCKQCNSAIGTNELELRNFVKGLKNYVERVYGF
jgi:hypothetical protein